MMRVNRNENGTLDFIEEEHCFGATPKGAEPETAPDSTWEKVIKAPTGAGGIDDYIGHPLNLNNSPALAKIIRGLTGILGNLDLAIVDIVMGMIQLVLDRQKQVA